MVQRKGKEPQPSNYHPPVPFPSALKTSKPPSEHEQKILESFKYATVSFSLDDVIRCVPPITKYVKEACTFINSIPKKQKDPGAPLITCEIGGMMFPKSLLDTGASVNIMPKALLDKFEFWEVEPICMGLLLADGSMRQPYGRLNDVMVRIKNYTFPVDFIVAEMNVTKNISHSPIILGHPFLPTEKAIINVEK